MTDEIRAKVLTIMELAMKINPTKTQQDVTNDKPTVFVNFSGHVCHLDVDLHLNGYRGSYQCDEVEHLCSHLSLDYNDVVIRGSDGNLHVVKTTKILDDTIRKLQEIYDKYKETEDNGNEEA